MSDQEGKISLLFKSIENEFSAFERIDDPRRADSKLSLITSMIRDCKGLIKEFEREARVDGRPTDEIQAAKQRYVSQVNSYVSRKKTAAAELKASMPQAHPSTSAQGGQEQGQAQQQTQEMTNGEIIQQGRQRMDDIDSELAKGKRIVMDTESTAAKTAAELKKQTDQMGRVVNDLNEIEFSMQRASKVLRDITRGLATDKCIMCLVFLVAAGIVAAIVMKILNVNDDVAKLPGPDDTNNETPPAADGNTDRKLLSTISFLLENF